MSLLFALSDTRTSLLVREAHDRAVAAALGYLEREAGEVRRGKDGVDRLPGGGFVAAAFRHRTSRAGDPQLHTHVLVANMTRGQDGRWSALDGRQLYWQAKTAGTLYQTALRHELRALGLRFVLRENGLCELADVPRTVLRAFSRRRVEIETELARRGESSRAAAQVATLATRKAKDYGVPAESLAAEWHTRAEALGFDAAARDRLLGRTTPVPPSRDVLAQAATVMLGPARVDRAVAGVRPARRRCAPGARSCPAAHRSTTSSGSPTRCSTSPTSSRSTEPTGPSLRPGAVRSLARHTTTDMLATEITVLNAAIAVPGHRSRRRHRRPRRPGRWRRTRCSPPNRRRWSASSPRPGTGSRSWWARREPARRTRWRPRTEAWTAAGHRVIGAAVAARAAVALTDEAGIPAVSVTRLLAADRAGPGPRHARGDPGRRGADRRRGRHARHPPTRPAPRGKPTWRARSWSWSGTTASCPSWPPAAPSAPSPASCPRCG